MIYSQYHDEIVFFNHNADFNLADNDNDAGDGGEYDGDGGDESDDV